MIEKNTHSKVNRIRETLDRLYDQQPPVFRDQLRKLQEDPTSRVFAPLAESYRRLGRVEEAIELCQRGLSHHPDFHGGRVALAKCYIDKQRYQDAQRELERVVHLAPENLLAQRLLGDVFLAQGMTKEALHALKMALLLSPCDIGLTDKIHQLENNIVEPVLSAPTDFVAETRHEFMQETLPESFPLTDEPDSEVIPAFTQPVPEAQFSDWEAKEMEPTLIAKISEPEMVSEDEEDEVSLQVNAVLGFKEEPEDVFSVGTLGSVFKEGEEANPLEITTETLGDLYFSQGQFGHSLKIFEKIYRSKPTTELEQKIKSCRVKLGVDPELQMRQQKIKRLQGILKNLQKNETT